MLLGGGERREAAAVARLACLVDGADRGAIEIHERRLDVELARLEQRLAGRHRHLLIDEMRDAGLPRARHQRLAERFDGLGLVRLEQAERHALRPRLPRRHQHAGAAHRKGEHAHSGAFEKDAPFHGVHGVLRGVAGARAPAWIGVVGSLGGVNDKEGGESKRWAQNPKHFARRRRLPLQEPLAPVPPERFPHKLGRCCRFMRS